MFNVSKKTLSVVLCLALLLSVVAVCFMTPATAKTVISTESVDVFKDLSKEVTPSVSLTFDGDAPYGIPFGRYAKGFTSYANNAYKLNGGGYWVFFGKDGTVGQSIVSYQESAHKTSETHIAAAAELYQFVKDKAYMVTFDVKVLANSTVGTSTITYGLVPDPSQGSGSSRSNMTSFSDKGVTLNYNINGVAQEAGTKMSVDSDWQTVSVAFTASADGKFGINPNFSGTNILIDNVKIYDLATCVDSTFQNKIDFDFGGFAVVRTGSGSYATEENGNKYGIVNSSKGDSVYFANDEYGTVIDSLYNNHTDEEGRKLLAASYSKMFKFESGKRYEVSFKYRLDATQVEEANYKVGVSAPTLRLMADPGGAAHAADNLLGSDSWAKDISYTGLILENEPGTDKWQDVKVAFTVKTAEETSSYAKIRANAAEDADPAIYNLTIEDTGAYFGIKSDYWKIHVDDYQVKLLTKEDVSIKTYYAYHDMEKDTFTTNKSGLPDGTLLANGGSAGTYETTGASIVDSGDKKYGNVAQLDGTGSRFTAVDANVLVEGRKYYISFDAKSTSGEAQTGVFYSIANLAFAAENNNFKGSQSNPRYNLSASSPFKYYVNGEETTYANFATLGTDWQHYGIVIDLTDATVVSTIKNKASTIFDTAKSFYLGKANSWYDNFTIVSTHDVEGAVPETEKADFSYVSKTYESTSASKIAVSATASLSEGVVSVTSGRFTFADSGIITAGHKYTFSFDAKLNSGETWLTMIVSYLDSSGKAPRYFINNGTDGSAANSSTNTAVRSAFKFYIVDENGEKVETPLADYKVTDTWQTFIVEFDYTDAAFLAATEVKFDTKNPAYMGQLTKDVNYFYVGANGGQFKNFKIVEETFEPVIGISYREAQLDEENNYRSAGLRFKAGVPTAVATEAAEIGFVVAPSTHASMTEDWYKLEGELNAIARKGVVKVKDSFDYIYNPDDTDSGMTEYQMVITGLSAEVDGDLEGKTAYNRRFSAVLYIKDAEGKYSYYALGESSYYQAFGNSSIFEAQ